MYLSREHFELITDVVNKYRIFQKSFFEHLDKIIKEEKNFDIEEEAERFKSNSKEGVELINAQKKLDKFKRDSISHSQ